MPTNATAEKIATTPADVKRANPRLTLGPTHLQSHDIRVNRYFIEVPQGHKFSDLLEPSYWAHHARKLTLHSTVDAVSMDGAFDATLRVAAKGDTWVKMRVLRLTEIGEADRQDPTPIRNLYKIDMEPNGKWRVIHKDTGRIEVSGLTSRADADAALDRIEAAQQAR